MEQQQQFWNGRWSPVVWDHDLEVWLVSLQHHISRDTGAGPVIHTEKGGTSQPKRLLFSPRTARRVEKIQWSYFCPKSLGRVSSQQGLTPAYMALPHKVLFLQQQHLDPRPRPCVASCKPPGCSGVRRGRKEGRVLLTGFAACLCMGTHFPATTPTPHSIPHCNSGRSFDD